MHPMAVTVKQQKASKGLLSWKVMQLVGEEYTTYLKGIMNLPFMLGLAQLWLS